MPFALPDLPTVRRTNRDNLAAFLKGADASVPNNALRVLSDQNAGGAFLNLKYLAYIAKNALPDKAEGDWLLRWAYILFGGPKAATFASGTIAVTGVKGTLLPAESILATSDSVEYQTKADVYLSGLATEVAVACLTAGAIGNRDAGAPLSLSVAVSNVNADAKVVRIDGGADTESDDDLRTRVLLRLRRPPQGGDADDYVQWALAVPGVTRAWSSPNGMGIGTVVVRFLCDALRAGNAGLPTDADLAAVRAYLDTVRPVCVKDFFVVAPIPQRLAIKIRNLSDDTPSTRLAIEAALQMLLLERAAPGQTIYAAWVSAAISEVVGDGYFDLDFADAVMASPGHMASLAASAGGGIAYP
ncbi:baseplate J/gp47 family protein [Methylobacterium sp. E-046]|uniref:baseplate J/gp47 family protein n=1 Tax=Methylobacterium sp. E-046 TaxID=2836576 RepID=UPI001FB885CC|nr:baseplate J/gp47 family protein [Methylobacterium sp. E-046]MCJ2102463.1 baseplate J/gp47 family protein [Methylobacterium sp. E-046]